MLNISPKIQLNGFIAWVIPNCIWLTCLDSWMESIVLQGRGSGEYGVGIVKRSILLGAQATDPFSPCQVCSTTGIFVPQPPDVIYPVVLDTEFLHFSSLYP